MGKCKNCNRGKVDGGFKVRRENDLKLINSNMLNEISRVSEKNKDKKLKMIKDIREKYEKLIDAKEKETAKRIGSCLYCGEKHA